MIHADARFHAAVEEAVGRLELDTDAEIVVVAAERSGSYRDITFAAASLVALLTLLVLIAVPFDIHPWVLPIDLLVTWLLVAWIANGQWFLRLLVPKARRRRQAEEAARAEFHRESVHATPHHTGVLIYVSALEGRVEVLPDLGIQGRVPGGRWSKACEAFQHDDLDHFLAGLDAIGTLLAEHVPPLETDLVDLPNAPRVRS